MYRDFSKNFGVTPPQESALTSAREICVSIRDSQGESLFRDRLRKRQSNKAVRKTQESLPRVPQAKDEDTLSTVYQTQEPNKEVTIQALDLGDLKQNDYQSPQRSNEDEK